MGALPSYGKSEIENITIRLPKIEEQQKIGDFFKNIDDLITLHQRKLTDLQTQKQGLLQKMFPKMSESVPELRFAGYTYAWEPQLLGEILTKNSKRNKQLEVTNVESVSNKNGFVKQTEQFDNYVVASADVSNYYIIKPGQFAYNPSRINVGSIAYKSKDQAESIVSPLYVSFSTDKQTEDSFL